MIPPDRFARLTSDLPGPPTGRRFRPLFEIILPLVIAGLLTWAVRATSFDLAAQEWIYRLGGVDWTLGEHPFWKWLYYGGTIPAALVVFAATAAFALSWKRAGLRPWRKVSLFLILAGVIGPGIITNAIVKEYWGRPRPRELVQFGGRSEFEPVLSYDGASEGLSFPCGHATMGFYFLVGYFLLRRHRPGWAQGVLFGSLVVGGFMGIARMTQGAHFFSDVIWAAVVCWYVPLGLYYAMGLDRSLVSVPSGTEKAMPLPMKVGLSALGLAMLTGVLLATPYEEKRTYTLMNDFTKEGPLFLRLVFAKGEVEIVPGPEYRLVAEAYGHGIPTSKIGRNYLELDVEQGSRVIYTERISGWFKEVNAKLRVEVPWDRVRRLELETGEANVRIVLAAATDRALVDLKSGEGKVTLSPGGRAVRVAPAGDPRIEGVDAGGLVTGAENSPTYRLEVAPPFSGRVLVEEAVKP